MHDRSRRSRAALRAEHGGGVLRRAALPRSSDRAAPIGDDEERRDRRVTPRRLVVLVLGDSRWIDRHRRAGCCARYGQRSSRPAYGMSFCLRLRSSPGLVLSVSGVPQAWRAVSRGVVLVRSERVRGRRPARERPSIPDLTVVSRAAGERLVLSRGPRSDWLDLSGAEGGTSCSTALRRSPLEGPDSPSLGRGSNGSALRLAFIAAAVVASPLTWRGSWPPRCGRPASYRSMTHSARRRRTSPQGATCLVADNRERHGLWFGPFGSVPRRGNGDRRRSSSSDGAFAEGTAPGRRRCTAPLDAPRRFDSHVPPVAGPLLHLPCRALRVTAGLVLRRPALAWSAIALTATTALLTLVHYEEKPSGLRLLDRSAVGSGVEHGARSGSVAP